MWKRIKSFLFENKTSKQTVAKNTVWLSISNFGGRLIKAIIVIYGARVLGAAGYGVFSYAVTLAGLFAIFIDLGINSILIRDGAKTSPDERQRLFSTTLLMKVILMAAVIIFIVTVAPYFSTLPGARVLLPFVALMTVFDGMREFLSSLFRAEEKMQWDAAAFLASNIAVVFFGFIFLRIAATPFSFTGAYALGTAVGAFVAVLFLRNRFKKVFSGVSLKRMGIILKSAWPFAIISALGVLLTSSDILIISWMKSASDVGIYSAGIRIIQLLYIIPTIIQLSTLPILSRLTKGDPGKFRLAFEKIFSLVFLVSLPISLGGAILGAQIMGLVFGNAYVVGGMALSILMLGISIDYAGGVISNSVFVRDHQKSLITCTAIAGVANILFDLLLIPRWGMAGSAMATLIALILSNSYLWYVAKKLSNFSFLPYIKRICGAGIIMAATTALLYAAGINVIANVLISGAVYILALLLLKEPLLREVKEVVALGSAEA
jgi:O-antigen/teichoic acid export membrane protein